MSEYNPQRDGLWWRAEEVGREPHEILEKVVMALRSKHAYRRIQARRNALYYGLDLTMLGIGTSVGTMDTDIFSLNAAANCIDTVASKTSKSRVLPQGTTDGGTQEEQWRAKNFNHFIEGIFNHCKVYEQDTLWVLDALIFDAAVAKVHDHAGELIVDRVFSWDLESDHVESRHGCPRTIYETIVIDREVLAEMYTDDPEKKELILNCTNTPDPDDVFAKDTTSDMIVMREAYRLPTSKGAGNGKWARIIANATLEFGEWESIRFPYVMMYAKPPLAGIWQRPMMSEIIPAQIEYDKMNRGIQECVDIMGVPRILAPIDSKIERRSLTDERGSIVYYAGPTPPQEWNATPVSPEVIQHRNQIPVDMMNTVGVNQMSASGQIPRGMEGASGRALQVLDDTESERMGIFWRSRERFYVDMAERALDVARRLSRENEDFGLMAPVGRKRSRHLKFADVDIGDSSYTLQVFSTNLLSKMPSARYQQLMEMRANGDISPQTFKRELGNPDIDAELSMETAPDDLVDDQIRRILVDGETIVVEPTDPHELILQRGTLALSRSKLDGDPRDRWESLLRYVQSAQKYMSDAQQSAQAASAAQQAGQMGPTMGAMTPAMAPIPPGQPGAPPQQ